MEKYATYLIYYYTDEYNTTTIYLDATSARDAVDILGVPDDDIIEVAKVIKDWKKSATYSKYLLEDENGHITMYKSTSEANAIARAKRTTGREWKVVARY